VEAGSRIFEGHQAGDVILQINQINVTTLEEYKKQRRRLKQRQNLLSFAGRTRPVRYHQAGIALLPHGVVPVD
jgi:hypothetical protein